MQEKIQANAFQRSMNLQELIKSEIQVKESISFARFMELALYTPDLGYYMAAHDIFGREGDFTTAPEYSRLFTESLAKQCEQVLQITSGNILEIGAGSGRMALELLHALEKLESLPEKYYILEKSPYLRQRQQKLLSDAPPHLQNRVVWLDTLPSFPVDGIILGNEVMDAFPVHRFRFTENHFREFYVTWLDNKFTLQIKESGPELIAHLAKLSHFFTDGYESECNLMIQPWIKDLSQVLNRGIILLLDYGFARHEYYHPDRHMGTLMCHYQHHLHADALNHIGLQDMTSHVDFTEVAESAERFGLEIRGYTNQASFLLSCGIVDFLEKKLSQANYDQLANELKILTSPNEMGELFKVIALAKKCDIPLLGFSLRNFPERLSKNNEHIYYASNNNN